VVNAPGRECSINPHMLNVGSSNPGMGLMDLLSMVSQLTLSKLSSSPT
jgi:hypothetical protein